MVEIFEREDREGLEGLEVGSRLNAEGAKDTQRRREEELRGADDECRTWFALVS